jgi:FKBP-type peptidyl-prolyl cis-trans isomerase SlyD
MQISNDLVGSIHYTLKNAEGEVLDSSEGQEPLEYVHGKSNIVIGLEKQLEGKSVGEKLSVVVSPEEGYGEFDPSLIQDLPKTMFAGVETIEVGMEFHSQTPEGDMQIIAVKAVEGDTITVDGNHPMAGQTLHFDIEITGVRAATADELEHGHVHGPSCDH